MPRAAVLGVMVSLVTVVASSAPAPADLESYLELGMRQLGEGDFEQAVFSLDAAVRGLRAGGLPSLARAYLYLGVAYLSLGNEKLAQARFRSTPEQDPRITLWDRSSRRA